MRLLDDHLARRSIEAGKPPDLFGISSGQHGGSPEKDCAGGAGRDHRRLHTDQLRDPLADFILQLIEIYKVL